MSELEDEPGEDLDGIPAGQGTADPSGSREGAPRAVPEVVPLALGRSRSADGAGTGCRRPAVVGGVVLMLMLMVLLVIGVQLTRRTMWLTAERALQRVRRGALEAPLEPTERRRLLTAIEQFQDRLPLLDDPYPAIGTLLGRVQSDLADGSLSRAEALALTELLEPLARGEMPQ